MTYISLVKPKIVMFLVFIIVFLLCQVNAQTSFARDTTDTAQQKIIEVGKTRISSRLPQGHCYLNKTDPQENAMIEYVDKVASPINHLYGVFAGCDILKQVKLGKSEELYPMGSIQQVAAVKGRSFKGKEVRVMKDICKRSMKVNRDKSGKINKQQQKQLDQGTLNIKVGERRGLGVLEDGPKFFMVGTIESFSMDNVVSTISTIYAQFMKNGQLLTVYYTDNYKGPQSVEEGKLFITNYLKLNDIIN